MTTTSEDFAATPGPAVTADFDWRSHRKYVVFIIAVAFFLNSLDRNIINILLQSIKKEFNLTDAELGTMTGLYFAILYNLVGLPVARWIDGGAVRRNIIAGGLALWSVATAMCGLAQNYWQMLLCRAAIGVGEGTFGPSTMTMVSDYFGPHERAKAMGTYLLGLPLAALVGLPLGGWVAVHYGWRSALMLVGFPGLIVALIVRLTVKEPPRGLAEGKAVKIAKPVPLGQVFALVKRKKTVMHLLAAASLSSFSTIGGAVWFPAFLQRDFGLNAAQVGASWGVVVGLSGALCAFGGGWLADRFGARNAKYYMSLPALTMAISLPFYLLATVTGSYWLCFACLIVPSALNNSWIPSGIAVTQRLAPIAMRGILGMLVTMAANLVGHGFAPPLIGFLSDTFTAHLGGNSTEGLRWALVASSVFYPWAALHFWLASRSIAGEFED
ncbi:MAG TPA: MFS transporter [Alphaproteobacteria bacterium]|nr:MFS transporter [Alphaproteobacteria bacterium]